MSLRCAVAYLLPYPSSVRRIHSRRHSDGCFALIVVIALAASMANFFSSTFAFAQGLAGEGRASPADQCVTSLETEGDIPDSQANSFDLDPCAEESRASVTKLEPQDSPALEGDETDDAWSVSASHLEAQSAVKSQTAGPDTTPTRGGVIASVISTPARPAWLLGAAPPTASRLPIAQITVQPVRRTPTPTVTLTPSSTPTETATETPSLTTTPSPTSTRSVTPSSTVTPTTTATPTTGPTSSATASDLFRLTPSASSTPVATPAPAPSERHLRVFADEDFLVAPAADVKSTGLTWVGRGNGPPGTPRDAVASSWWLSPNAPTAWEVREDPRVSLMARNMSATFDAMRKCFPGVSGQVCGFRPGDAYDAIYVRDSAYLSAVTRYAFSPMHLRSVVEEVLTIQYDETDTDLAVSDRLPRLPWPSRPGDGAISAVIDYDLRREKASVASDEEQSLIRAAYVAFRTDGGASWLRKPLRGRSLIDRLALALNWTLEHRRDDSTGLIIRPHTTDWGDVESGDDGTWGGDAPPTAWTASIYDQAVTYRALREMAIMCAAIGETSRSRTYNTLADELRSRTREHLWSDSRGYFRTHIHVLGAPPGMRPIRAPFTHEFDEDEIVSVANAIAIYAGLADEGQTARATEALEQARTRARSPIPGVALFPAYPPGAFRSPQMAPGRYQNGAVWDWWAGTQIVAEFARGYSNQGYVHLASMAKAWSDHPEDIPEWRTVDPDSPVGVGRPAGSGHYAAAAGTVGEAVLFGLFGLELTHETWSVTPRLGSLSGQARVRIPTEKGDGSFLVVGQRVSREGGALLLAITYATNHPNQGWLAVRLPSDQPPTAVRLDGQSIGNSWVLTTAGSDTMLTIGAADSGRHDLEVEWRAMNGP